MDLCSRIALPRDEVYISWFCLAQLGFQKGNPLLLPSHCMCGVGTSCKNSKVIWQINCVEMCVCVRCVCVCVHARVCRHEYVHFCLCVFIYVPECIVCVCVCVYVHACVCVIENIKGSQPEWCVSSLMCSRDTPFWSETLDMMWKRSFCNSILPFPFTHQNMPKLSCFECAQNSPAPCFSLFMSRHCFTHM